MEYGDTTLKDDITGDEQRVQGGSITSDLQSIISILRYIVGVLFVQTLVIVGAVYYRWKYARVSGREERVSCEMM